MRNLVLALCDPPLKNPGYTPEVHSRMKTLHKETKSTLYMSKGSIIYLAARLQQCEHSLYLKSNFLHRYANHNNFNNDLNIILSRS